MTDSRSYRARVLDMLKDGTITVEQAEALLEKLADPQPEAAGYEAGSDSRSRRFEFDFRSRDARPAEPGTQAGRSPRFLRVQVETTGGDQVNIRLPLSLVRTGVNLSTLMPREARDSIQQQGIDLDALALMDPDELVRALAELTVDVQSAGGDNVRIFCE